jgi:hypothetical protein
VAEPRLIVADEPTGNLDTRSDAEVMEMLDALNQQGATILEATHSAAHANPFGPHSRYCRRPSRFRFRPGRGLNVMSRGSLITIEAPHRMPGAAMDQQSGATYSVHCHAI